MKVTHFFFLVVLAITLQLIRNLIFGNTIILWREVIMFIATTALLVIVFKYFLKGK